MNNVEKALFWCGISLCVALIAILTTIGMASWINGLVIPYVAIGGVIVGMRLKAHQYKTQEGG